MSLFVLDTGFEFVKLIAVNVRKILHFRNAADAYDPAGGDIESEVPADALLGLDLGQPFLPAGGDIEKKALSVETAGVVDQLRPKPVMIFVFRSRTRCRSSSSAVVGKMRLLAAKASGRSK